MSYLCVSVIYASVYHVFVVMVKNGFTLTMIVFEMNDTAFLDCWVMNTLGYYIVLVKVF